MKKVIIAFTVLLSVLPVLCACGGGEGKPTEEIGPDHDVVAVAQALERAGNTATYYLQGSEMLEALDEEMDGNLEEPTEHPLFAYLFAKDGADELFCEVFVFQTADDAQKLYDLLAGGEQFIDGVSAIRRDGTMVYMGFIEALGIIEGAEK